VVLGLATAWLVAPAEAAPVPTCHGRPATVVGTSGPDRLIGTAGPDVVVGLGGRDIVRGRGGDDVLCGGGDADRLWGGPGDDRLHGGRDGRGADGAGNFLVGDQLRGGAGDDLLDLGEDGREGHQPPDTVAYDEAPGPVVVDLRGEVGTVTGDGTDTVVLVAQVAVLGSPYADTITGTAGPDALSGDDSVDGGAGDDLLNGDDALSPDFDLGPAQPAGAATDDDLVHGGAGTDVLWSGSGHDDLHGDGDRDVVQVTGTGPTSVDGGPGPDVVDMLVPATGGGSTDGGPGFDHLTVYGSDVDPGSPRPRYTIDLRSGLGSVSSDPAATGAVGGYEEYRLMGRLRWRFLGTPDADRVWAMSGGPLRALTFGGDDWMIGTARADHLDGGAGTDEADGREAADTCIDIEQGKPTC
jgi:Ca2+-binding RTX toxin-like protein